MAPIRLHHYAPRAMSRSMSYTLLLALLTGSAVVIILFWGLVLPCLRKRYFPPKPSRTKYNQHLFASSGSLPLIRSTNRSLRRRTANDLERQVQDIASYNPRYESPFPNVPRPDSIVLPTWTPTRDRSPVMDTNQSLFTPVRQDSPYPFVRPSLARIGVGSPVVGRDQSPSTSVRPDSPYPFARPSPPKVKDRSGPPVSGALGTDFGDAREYILAVPEPLRVSSRTLGRQPVTASPLNSLPDSIEMSTPAEKHAKKLFERLNAQGTQGSECSSTSLKIHKSANHRNSLSAEICTAEDVSDEEDVDSRLSFQFPEKKGDQSSKNGDKDVHDTSAMIWSEEKTDPTEHNASVTAMHRLRTYRSLVGAPPPEPLSRAGTLTRPKTPVATIRNIYDQKKDDGKATNKTVSRNNTISTLFRTATGSSDGNSPQSPATSPLKASPERLRASSSSLVPTPLRIQRSPEARSVSSPMKRGSKFKEQLGHTEGYHASMREEDVGTQGGSAVPTTSNRPRPAPLTLAANARLPISQQSPRFASSPIGARLMPPQHRSQIQSLQASSVYSCDILGHSIEHTPVTPDFPNAGVLQPMPFSPYVTSTIGETNESSDKGTETHLIATEQRRGNPRTTVDTASQKVENWNIEGMEWDFDESPSSSLKRALSTIGPNVESREGVKVEEEEEDQKSLYSTISTEINPSEARLSVVVGSPLRTSGYGGAVGALERANWF